MIVGFPGETKDDFLETYNFLNDLDISYLHVFTYSERANTLAETLKGKVHGSERSDRNTMLRTLSEKKRRFFYEQHLTEKTEVLFESEEENGTMFGFTNNYIKVVTAYDPLWVNEIKKVKLKAINAEGFVEVEPVVELVASR